MNVLSCTFTKGGNNQNTGVTGDYRRHCHARLNANATWLLTNKQRSVFQTDKWTNRKMPPDILSPCFVVDKDRQREEGILTGKHWFILTVTSLMRTDLNWPQLNTQYSLCVHISLLQDPGSHVVGILCRLGSRDQGSKVRGSLYPLDSRDQGSHAGEGSCTYWVAGTRGACGGNIEHAE